MKMNTKYLDLKKGVTTETALAIIVAVMFIVVQWAQP